MAVGLIGESSSSDDDDDAAPVGTDAPSKLDGSVVLVVIVVVSGADVLAEAAPAADVGGSVAASVSGSVEVVVVVVRDAVVAGAGVESSESREDGAGVFASLS